jgi:CHAT domain-containing protein
MRIPADLAVLSACETATGRSYGSEGIVGLVRAFMFAGAPRVICSLWDVDDDATQALMRAFYARWNPKDGSQGVPPAAALRAAQEEVRSDPRWKHPAYWAAWVLWGLPE